MKEVKPEEKTPIASPVVQEEPKSGLRVFIGEYRVWLIVGFILIAAVIFGYNFIFSKAEVLYATTPVI